ncbi:phospholipase D-like domain-containing protein [Methylobacterium brachiatum]|uniref:phospholipase D-like domain-containing protein n=1 Tax=Methylobacterium brachiatum TaxID=269660 RepID=UPI0008E81D5E|nr:phospholipase D-like domain-containing protein [Methylobacterium brachiatum]SFH92444.1 PLD-like domain-containing protein [Methylobacterium brachiatum]
MAKIVKANAWCNNEVGYLAWRTDGPIQDCLGFMITRIHSDLNGNEVERRILPAWVAFKSQSNPKGEEQDTSVWPVQKFSWRDLTLRRSRNETVLREGEFKARYEIVPVGLAGHGRMPVPSSPTAPYRDAHGEPRYNGDPIQLFFCGKPIETNEILVTNRFGAATVAFNNGILSTQNLRKQLQTPDGRAPGKKEVLDRMADPKDSLRRFLSGDAIKIFRRFFNRAVELDANIHLALYELHDDELIALIDKHCARISLILSTAGKSKDSKTWDTTNHDARDRLGKRLGKRLQNRMFNNSKHIGHNKFGVLVSRTGEPLAVLTGSTNWTSTGLCGQTNNAIFIEDGDLAAAYLEYWGRLHDDLLPEPDPLSAPNKVDQGAALREADAEPNRLSLDSVTVGAKASVWCSPNTEKVAVPRTNPATPPDIEEVFALMRSAKDALLFLSFYPAQQGRNSIIGEAVKIAQGKPELLVLGAISAPQAMPNYEAPMRDDDEDDQEDGEKVPAPSIYTLKQAPRVLMVRASAVRDLIGDFQRELLTAGTAIIHDKVVVIDPLSETDCVVITGSHNLGFKASYANDENMLIIRGAPALAAAYAVHVLDVQDHYRFRAVLEEQRRRRILSRSSTEPSSVGSGFLHVNDEWQTPYFDGRKGDELRYFAR